MSLGLVLPVRSQHPSGIRNPRPLKPIVPSRARRRIGTSCFLDVSAGVDRPGSDTDEEDDEEEADEDAEDEDEEEEDEDEEDEDEVDGEGGCDKNREHDEDDDLDDLRIDAPSVWRRVAHRHGLDDEEAREIAAAVEDRWRGRGRGSDAVGGMWVGGKSNLEHQMDLPDTEDPVMYSLKVKTGKEPLMVTRLLKKCIRMNLVGVSSVVFVPKAPGRIYIEGRASMVEIRKLCQDMHFLYMSSLFVIPIEERVSLLADTDTRVPFSEGDHVKIRTGLYLGDIGTVVDVSPDPVMLTIKVKSRETRPEEIGSAAIRSNLKRKREGRTVRQDPHTVSRDRLRAMAASDRKHLAEGKVKVLSHFHVASSFKDLGAEGFFYLSKRFSADGYRILRLRPDRVERARLGIEDYNEIRNTESRRFAEKHVDDMVAREIQNAKESEATRTGLKLKELLEAPRPPIAKIPPAVVDGTVHKAIARFRGDITTDPARREAHDAFDRPCFFEIGDPVRVTGGASKGSKGRVEELTTRHTALVDLGTVDPDLGRTVIEFDTDILCREFCIGEQVEVKIGSFAGKTGFVTAVNEDKLTVVNPFNKFIEEFPAWYCQISNFSYSKRKDPSKGNFGFGWPVIVKRGKHGGKTGRVVGLLRDSVRLMEDGTEIEIIVRDDNVELFGTPPDISKKGLDHEGLEDPNRPEFDRDKFKEGADERKKEAKRIRREKRRAKSEKVDQTNGYGVSSMDVSPAKDHEAGSEGESSEEETESLSGGSGGKCAIDHFAIGFEGVKVYVWSGHFKGKFGKILRVSGPIARLSTESAMFAKSILDVQTKRLLAECGCVVDGKEELTWSAQHKARIPDLFRPVLPDSRNLPVLISRMDFRQNSPPLMIDPRGHGMWIFHERIAHIRRDYDLIVRIDAHPDATVSGCRDGRVLREEEPLRHPIPADTTPAVPVTYSDGKLRPRTDRLPASTLSPTARLRTKGLHVIIEGERIGLLVTHVHSERETARVFPAGQDRRKTSFSIEKTKLCIVEKYWYA